MQSFIPWIGGKRALCKEILARFPSQLPTRYVEVFGGAAWVLFGKEVASGQIEVYNDLDGNLVNLFRCVKYHCSALQEELTWLLSSRQQFLDYREQLGMHGLTDIQRAARFYYLLKVSFGANFKIFATSPKMPNLNMLPKIQARLQHVIIEQRDFAALIRTYDRPGALFYVDPPYLGSEELYTVSFTQDDHQRLAQTLRQIKGKFILSYNDTPLVRSLYKGYRIDAVTRRNELPAKSKSTFAEVIIRNY